MVVSLVPGGHSRHQSHFYLCGNDSIAFEKQFVLSLIPSFFLLGLGLSDGGLSSCGLGSWTWKWRGIRYKGIYMSALGAFVVLGAGGILYLCRPLVHFWIWKQGL